MIYERHTKFERVPHAQPVRQSENVLRKIGLHIHIEGATKIVRSAASFVRFGHEPVGGLEVDVASNVWRKQLCSLVGVQGRNEVQITFGWRPQRRRREPLAMVDSIAPMTGLRQPPDYGRYNEA